MRSACRALVGSLVVATILAASGRAAADPRDPAAAEALFTEGRRLVDEGRHAEACPKFEESHRLDPGAGTMINLAACYEQVGKVATAWESWKQALRSLPAGDERGPAVEARVAAVEARLPKLRILLPAGVPTGTRVSRGGVPLGPAALGLALPVDPGRHTVEVLAPGHDAKRYEIDLAEQQLAELVAEPGPRSAAPAPPPGKPAALPASPTPASPAPEEARPAWPAWTLLGVGTVGLGAGAVTGVLALGKKSDMQDDCARERGELRCGAKGLEAADAGSTLATVSNVGFAVGIVGVVAGTYLLLSRDDERALAVGWVPGAASASLRQSF